MIEQGHGTEGVSLLWHWSKINVTAAAVNRPRGSAESKMVHMPTLPNSTEQQRKLLRREKRYQSRTKSTKSFRVVFRRIPNHATSNKPLWYLPGIKKYAALPDGRKVHATYKDKQSGAT